MLIFLHIFFAAIAVLCCIVMIGSVFIPSKEHRWQVWRSAALMFVVAMFFGFLTNAFWVSELVESPRWLRLSIAGSLLVALAMSGAVATGWTLRDNGLTQATSDARANNAKRSSNTSENKPFLSFALASIRWLVVLWFTLSGINAMVGSALYLAPQASKLIEAPVANVERKHYTSRGGSTVVKHWTVVLPEANAPREFKFNRSSLFNRHKAQSDNWSDDLRTPGRNCLYRAISNGDVLTLRVRQDPLWGVAIDELVGIEGPSGPPCTTREN